MYGVRRILVLIIFFVTITIFTTGVVSANNWTVNPGDNIQSIINNASANDTITVNDYYGSNFTFNENIVINKTLTLKAETGGNVIIQALNSSIPTIAVNSGGSGCTIQGFIIRGATSSYGVYLNGAVNCNISGNIITGNYNGIELTGSNGNTIYNNTITSNNNDGLRVVSSINNNVIGNIIMNHTVASGIYLGNSNGLISENTITGNDFGIYMDNSSPTVQFNRITGNDVCGLYGTGTVNAINNWWGTNNPVIAANPSDIWSTGGTITYNPWLVITLSSSGDNLSHNASCNVTADLTHNNQGADTSSSGKVPDNTSINFTTTMGTIATPVSTRNGKSVSNINTGSITGLTTITATLDRQSVSKTLTIVGIFNNRTQIGYTSIQAAVNAALTGDTIWVENGTYTENIVVGKNLKIKVMEGNNVTVQASSTSSPVFTITSSGTGSTIQGFTIKGATGTSQSGIYINGASNCTISGNNITNNYNGIDSYYSDNTTIEFNNITNNSWMGINLSYLNNNSIQKNNITNNDYGIHIGACNNINIIGNLISGTGRFGINPQGSNATINFNSITGFSIFGIIGQSNSIINASDNWWGTNSPTYYNQLNWPAKADLMIEGFPVIFNSSLVLNITSSSANLAHNNSCNVTVDLTHNNQGSDTSTNGNTIPDNIPINFTTNLGTITTTVYTKNGRSVTSFNSGQINGLATISATLNCQTVSKSIQVMGIFNNRTQINYTSIQAAINDNLTLNNDTIIVEDGTYTENIIINKKLTIKAQNNNKVIIQAASSSSPVFTINSQGTGAKIQGFTIKDATGTSQSGIYINGASNCTISGNNITNNYNGIDSYYSDNTTIEFNDITNNSWMGINLSNLNSNVIRDNLLYNNDYGIHMGGCNNITITGNSIYGTGRFGINTQGSNATISFNTITQFSIFGVISQYNGIVNVTNNYWGTNSPVYVESLNWPNTADVYSEASTVTYNPWCSKDTELSRTNIIQAAATLKTYIETNRQLPSFIDISGTKVSMPQFLQLLTQSVLEIKNNTQNINITLEFLKYRLITTHEQISKGVILDAEYLSIANTTKSFIDEYGYAPNYMAFTSLGSYMGFESLIYMYSQILSQYNINQTLPSNVTVTPWLAFTNPNGTYNIRTNELFTSIQAAIDDTDTQNGDTITLGKYNYSENVVINKTVAIISLFGNTTITALNPDLPVFTITVNGSGSLIENLIINGSTNNAGILINSTNSSTISGNNITGNRMGISLYNSHSNIISGNTVSNNNHDGISVNISNENNFVANIIKNNGFNGINITSSINNTIYSNLISNNTLSGIYLDNSPTNITFNGISMNTLYGLYNTGNSTINALNNWWGSNNPIIFSNSTSDIRIDGGVVNCEQWLMLNVTSSIDRSNRTNNCYNTIITADLTHNNHGDDTSKKGDTVPDGIPVNFTTTLGTISTPVSTRKGKATATLSSSTTGTANISTILDRQTINITLNQINITALAIHNNRTGEGFTSIQSAINDSDTISGDVIVLNDGTYTENVVIHKPITVKPVTTGNVTVRASDEDKSVFLIVNRGSGATVQGLKINSATDSYGISLSSANKCNLTGNFIEGNYRGIYIYLSNNTIINNNTLYDNYYGIAMYNSTSNNISTNNITGSYYGVYLINSNSTAITGNSVIDNWDGIHLYTSTGNNLNSNTVNGNWIGVYLYQSNSTGISGNIVTSNGGGICTYDSNSTTLSGNNVTDNWLSDTSKVDSAKMVMATTIYTCGPAALATVMKTLGVNATEEELARLAGTDETGTTMWGLAQAAKAKGLNANGYHLNTTQLQTNYIVVLKINGVDHYNIIRNITNTTVFLIDPNLGEIEMSLEKFNELYTGYALVISNGTIQINGTVMTEGEMKNIKGMWHYVEYYATIYYPYIAWKWYSYSFYVPYIYLVWHPIQWWGRTVGWYPSFHLGWKKVTIGFWIPTFGYRAVNILVRRDMVADPVIVNAASVDQYGQVIQNNPTVFKYDTVGILRTQLQDKQQQGALLIVGGAALCVVGFWPWGVETMVDGVGSCFDVPSPPTIPNPTRY